jgi:hypothetical protein
MELNSCRELLNSLSGVLTAVNLYLATFMNMKLTVLTLLLISGAFIGSSAKAQLLNFDFSFTGNLGSSTTKGTVTGEIIGLTNNGTSTPSDIILTSIPLGFSINVPPSYSLKNNGWNLSGDAEGASFTVTNGVITSATDYEASLAAHNGYLSFDVPLVVNNVELGPLNGFQYGSPYVSNTAGFQGVTYTIISAPEPASWSLAVVGALALAVAIRRRPFFLRR